MSLDNFAMATVEELTLDVGLITGGECLGYPAPGLISGPRPSALGPQKIFSQLNFLLPKVQSLWLCAHYFQWRMGYLNHVDLLLPNVHASKKLFNVHLNCAFKLNFVLWISSQLTNTCSKVITGKRAIYLFRNKSCKAYFILRFIIAPNWNKLWTNDNTDRAVGSFFMLGGRGEIE